jgi:DNA-binding NarL/FixJ family response regulator
MTNIEDYDDGLSKNSLDLSRIEYEKLKAENKERLKELACINETVRILKEAKNIDEALHLISGAIPRGMQYPEDTTARITYDGKVFTSVNFKGSQWVLRQNFDTIDKRVGSLEIFYISEHPKLDLGPFLKEEQDLIDNLSSLIKGYLDGDIANKLSRPNQLYSSIKTVSVQKPRRSKLLQLFLNRNNYNRDLYHDLMPFKIKEILLVASLYDAFSIESGGRFSEYVLRQYERLNLTSVPRITGVSDSEDAMEHLKAKHFDMVIMMVGMDTTKPLGLAARIKEAFPYLPVFALLNNNENLIQLQEKSKELPVIDKVFVWKGDSQVFFSMIKLIEDKINVDNDTRMGLVRVIIIVEDAPTYYSRYLPMLYNIVMEQTRRIIDDVSTDDLYKVLRLRTRPKILLATSYEEAIRIYKKYSSQLLCLITDVEFEKEGKLNKNAGIDLVREIKSEKRELPIVIQSSDKKYEYISEELDAAFIDKNSESLMQDLRTFILHYLGFGNFVFRDLQGREIAVARSLREFENLLHTIPEESIVYHGNKNHFSLWLMARGEIQVAHILHPAQIADFPTPDDLRKYIITILNKFRNEQNKGKVVPFHVSDIDDPTSIVLLGEGNLGGKGRGLAFINTLIHNYDFSQLVQGINIKTPNTCMIGTDEFLKFMESNNLRQKVYDEKDYNTIKKWFLEAQFSEMISDRLYKLLKFIEKPIAVRSSGMFEDSIQQPFAGIFETYILPNSDPDIKKRQEQLEEAIKLVYASVFSKLARGYVEAISYKIEEEMMAVVIQEVVGNQYHDYFYPHISGVAQSYNYYPVSHMEPDDGMAVMAIGLGKYVVDGEKAYRFSPKYPQTMIHSLKDLYKESQVEFYAVDMKRKEIDFEKEDMAGLIRLDIDDAEMHGTLKHCASVYDPEGDRLIPGLSYAGPRVVNFANILRHNYIPLSKTIQAVLDIVEEALGSPVEIEFAVDLNKDSEGKASFYLLQIKPQISSWEGYSFDEEDLKDENVILFTDKAMGNGIIDSISDIIIIDKEKFDKSHTKTMAEEIEAFNETMKAEKRKYLLIGPGRWGTRDPWIGIPVDWPQISNAKVIVETDLDGFPLEASSGSHFFHNVTSMNVGYFSVNQSNQKQFINWDFIFNQPLHDEKKYFKHFRLDKPFTIKIDGKKRNGTVIE